MSIIRILPEGVANQIAAGEVVERPASVVKELVENSIDAGARRVDVAVEGDGTRLLRVVDDGCGMDGDDALLCLERHATSKLRRGEDLLAIATMGFRGEAIPSIAAVSRFTLRSRPAASEAGTQVEVHYGTVRQVRETGCPPGTVVEVRNLFGNLPARRKFLKSRRTELAHIDEVVRCLALANPAVAFTLTVDGRRQLALESADEDSPSRFLRLYRQRLQHPLVRLAGEEGGVAVAGALLSPAERPSALRLRLFVNGRIVRNQMVVRAVFEGAGGFVMKGWQPAGILLLRLDPAAVDVNVHPTKQEVRFRDGQRIYRAVAAAVRAGLVAAEKEQHRALATGGPAAVTTGPVTATPGPATTGAADRRPAPPVRPVPAEVAEPQVPAAASPPPAQSPASAEARTEAAGLWPDTAPLSLRLIGQLFDSYILCEGAEGLVVVDQHAAQERLLYERFRRQHLAGQVARQRLLFPALVELAPAELQAAEQFADTIRALGVVAEPFGGNSYRILEIPALLGQVEPETLFREIVGRYLADGRLDEQRLTGALARLACRQAVKAGARLDPEQCRALLRQMEEADIFSHCPHGRPVFRTFHRREVGRWFHRS